MTIFLEVTDFGPTYFRLNKGNLFMKKPDMTILKKHKKSVKVTIGSLKGNM